MTFMIQQLTKWQQQVFAAALLQRMLPNYSLFASRASFGDDKLLQNQLDLVWQKLAKLPIKINLEAQLDKLEAVTPQPQDFDLFAVYPAQDVCSGMTCLLQSLEEKESQCGEELSQLSLNSVKTYLDFSIMESHGHAPEAADLQQDPLMEWELATQQELVRILATAIENKQTCDDIKAMVKADRLSNLGIEY